MKVIAEPHLSLCGRDAPDYDYLAPLILRRNKGASHGDLTSDLQRELRAAYAQGRNDLLTEYAERELAKDA